MTNLDNSYPFTAIPFAYSYAAFEPRLSGDTMQHHYENIYLQHISELNRLLSSHPEYHDMTLGELITNNESLPNDIRLGIYDNAGGAYNHEVFFETIQPYPSVPYGIVADEITASFGTSENMLQNIAAYSNAMSGSGYIVLAKRNTGALVLIAVENETTTLEDNMYPILIFDLWEHAYANNFDSAPEYIAALYNIINWEAANRRYNTPFDFEQPLTANN